MKKDKTPLKEEILEELPLIFRFPVSRYNTYSRPISMIKSSFYQSRTSICFPLEKPISKIIPLNEKIY